MSEDDRIREIRAVVAELDAIHPLDLRGIPSVGSVIDRIRAILDSVPPAPRVFLPDDEVPLGTVIMSKEGCPFRVYDDIDGRGFAQVGAPFVEVLVPSPEEWQAAVDRAKAARDVEGQHTEGTNP